MISFQQYKCAGLISKELGNVFFQRISILPVHKNPRAVRTLDIGVVGKDLHVIIALREHNKGALRNGEDVVANIHRAVMRVGPSLNGESCASVVFPVCVIERIHGGIQNDIVLHHQDRAGRVKAIFDERGTSLFDWKRKQGILC